MRSRALVPLLALALGTTFAGGGTANADPLDAVLEVVREHVAPEVGEIRDALDDPPTPRDLIDPWHEDLRHVTDYVKEVRDGLPVATP